MIAILDYDMGNVCSIQNMLRKIGEETVISREPSKIMQADKIILPGVGNFDTGMKQLSHYGLVEQVRIHAVEKQKPLLGICLGMQLLGRRSEEGLQPGLGLIPFDVVRFDFDSANAELRVPHMGWDYTTNTMFDPLTDGLDALQRYYFVHSYYAKCDNGENTLMTCDYGVRFAASVKLRNIYGVQFHPEKSHIFGMQLLKNFAQKV